MRLWPFALFVIVFVLSWHTLRDITVDPAMMLFLSLADSDKPAGLVVAKRRQQRKRRLSLT